MQAPARLEWMVRKVGGLAIDRRSSRTAMGSAALNATSVPEPSARPKDLQHCIQQSRSRSLPGPSFGGPPEASSSDLPIGPGHRMVIPRRSDLGARSKCGIGCRWHRLPPHRRWSPLRIPSPGGQLLQAVVFTTTRSSFRARDGGSSLSIPKLVTLPRRCRDHSDPAHAIGASQRQVAGSAQRRPCRTITLSNLTLARSLLLGAAPAAKSQPNEVDDA